MGAAVMRHFPFLLCIFASWSSRLLVPCLELSSVAVAREEKDEMRMEEEVVASDSFLLATHTLGKK